MAMWQFISPNDNYQYSCSVQLSIYLPNYLAMTPGFSLSRMTTTISVLWNCAIIWDFPFLNNPKDLDPSHTTDLDFWDCFGMKKLRFITEEIRKCMSSLFHLSKDTTLQSKLTPSTVSNQTFASQKWGIIKTFDFRQHFSGYTVANFWHYPIRHCVTFVCALLLLFYVHGKHLSSCWDGQLT